MEPFVELLVRHGRDFYGSGTPSYHFSETINAVTALKPMLRRSGIYVAGGRIFHASRSVLLAVLSACLAWGWLKEAALFALCWGALLRVSGATRVHLVFPADALWTQAFILVKIDEPRTRGRAAKHRAAKLEPSDLVPFVSLAFEESPEDFEVVASFESDFEDTI